MHYRAKRRLLKISLISTKEITMLDHTSLTVNDYQKSLTFYDKTLSLLGYERLVTIDVPEWKGAGYGTQGSLRPSFWIGSSGDEAEDIGRARGLHIAFIAPTVETIQKWYQMCLDNGGTSNGAPGQRPHYHPGYYGGFIIDPNGWRIEACLHHYGT
jgi:catechol 2,3-dioxygenase-like lactoylglutathione lyase family enzyme